MVHRPPKEREGCDLAPVASQSVSSCSSRMLKNSFTPRLLKKVQMQGGASGTHPQDGCRCEAYLRVRRSAARARQRGRGAFFSSLLVMARFPLPNFASPSPRRRSRCLVPSAVSLLFSAIRNGIGPWSRSRSPHVSLFTILGAWRSLSPVPRFSVSPSLRVSYRPPSSVIGHPSAIRIRLCQRPNVQTFQRSTGSHNQ